MACLGVLTWAVGCSPQTGTKPHPSLPPQEVVRLQVSALQKNDQPHKDAGIEMAFRFASPGNQETTGPIDRFKELVHTPAYAPMLGHLYAEYDELVQVDDVAVQRVVLTTEDDERVAYVFHLSRVAEGKYSGCWMTDAVIQVPAPPQPGFRL